jgi:hypothetical protein
MNTTYTVSDDPRTKTRPLLLLHVGLGLPYTRKRVLSLSLYLSVDQVVLQLLAQLHLLHGAS